MGDLTEMLEVMRKHGESVSLCWGESDKMWTCCWTIGKRRHVANSASPVLAVKRVMEQVYEEAALGRECFTGRSTSREVMRFSDEMRDAMYGKAI